MKILNTDFSESVIWSNETLLPILKKANPNRTEKELIALIKASKLVKNELQTDVVKSKKRKNKPTIINRNADNI